MNTINKKLFRNLGIMVGIFLVLLSIIWIVQLFSGARMSYSKLEQTMANAAKEYFEKTKSLPGINNEKAIVSLDTLMQGNYLKPLDKLTKDTTCTGTITVMKNGEDYLYLPKLSCSKYHTKTLKEELINKVVTTKDGLYSEEDAYFFKGEYVDNYLTFNNELWRIINIDSNGNIRMIRNTKEKERYVWDDRYNLDKKENIGINNYEVSRIREILNSFYQERISDKEKKYLIGQDVCLDKRKETQNAIGSFSCENVMKDEKVTLISAEDFAKASLDSNCKTIDEKSCGNYNYMSSFSTSWTMTPTAEYSYKVYAMTAQGASIKNTDIKISIYPVITILGDQIYLSGTGSKEDPYKILQN